MPDVIVHLWLATDTFALVSVFDQEFFVLNGFVILPMWQRLNFKFDFKYKKFYSEILANRISKRLINIANGLNVDCFDAIVNQLYHKKSFVIIHPEFKYLDTVWVGSINRISRKSLFVKTVSTLCEDMGIIKIHQKDITQIEFLTRYVSIYERFSQFYSEA
ncbi:hypothetical protein [Stenoxybacter acetivorans]|uniref:hypothetical protein n=1 Tax=Stenoxybacter acetivorans TaxID=422441 RepID=UPI0012EC480A|nr:hypothetical protein [Stenoxybacter acetivorans]